VFLAVYLAALAASTITRAGCTTEVTPSPQQHVISVAVTTADRPLAKASGARAIRLAYLEYGPPIAVSDTPILLLHGSPGSSADFRRLGPALAGTHRVIAPDLPGFGASSRSIPDYSSRAHARYVLDLLDELRIQRIHVVGYSMGGGVALSMDALAPARVASLTILSAVGVQELELFGDYSLNHFVHGVQIAGFWVLLNAVPHFGALDSGMMNLEYARNFFDTDQRPFRSILLSVDAPTLILHGRFDSLVPFEAAIEHHRLVPQSELRVFDDGHFMTIDRPADITRPIAAFVANVDAGRGVRRRDLDSASTQAAQATFDPAHLPPLQGVGLSIVAVALVLVGTATPWLAGALAGALLALGCVGALTATVPLLVVVGWRATRARTAGHLRARLSAVYRDALSCGASTVVAAGAVRLLLHLLPFAAIRVTLWRAALWVLLLVALGGVTTRLVAAAMRRSRTA
jgi:pimeloyl-ACP methyl ester carboxylesterase